MKNNLYSPIGQILIKYIKCEITLYNLFFSCKFGNLIAHEKLKLEYAKKLGLHKCAEKGYLHYIQLLHKYNIKDYSLSTIEIAIENGHLEIVKYLYRDGYKLFPNIIDQIRYTNMVLAIKNGHLEIVKFLYHIEKEYWDNEFLSDKIRYSFVFSNIASENGHLEILKWLYENITNCDISYAIHCAGINGHIEVVKWLYYTEKNNKKFDWTIELAKRNRHLEVVEFLQQKWATSEDDKK